ncbi:MAG: hypothetical protein G01um101416_1152 [Microgenomates group bacterium Gr01-1014_16]|nr:MAG: hypothetical protein G01um101416_1152 [Microgenomates group bacterium Gr01-1014_16]
MTAGFQIDDGGFAHEVETGNNLLRMIKQIIKNEFLLGGKLGKRKTSRSSFVETG